MIPSVVTKEESALDQHESRALMKLSDHGGSGGGLTVREKKKEVKVENYRACKQIMSFQRKNCCIYTLCHNVQSVISMFKAIGIIANCKQQIMNMQCMCVKKGYYFQLGGNWPAVL